MAVKDFLSPSSFDQIVYAVLLWIIIVLGSSYFYDSPLLRLEILIGTGLLIIWVIWGIFYRLEQMQKKRYGSKR